VRVTAISCIAEQGDAFAQFELALALDFGNGGEQDFDKAAVWSFDTNHGTLSRPLADF
jgi:TPR repeat protein